MHMAFRSLGVAAILAVALAGCARKEAPRAPRPAPPVIVAPTPSPATAEDYVQQQSSRALLVVRASELATQRSTNGKVLAIADRLKRDHTGIAAQLSMAGRRLNLLPSASLLSVDQVQYDGLARASDFETAYLRTMRSAIEHCSRSNLAYANGGSSPTLRPVARFAASTCEDELRSL